MFQFLHIHFHIVVYQIEIFDKILVNQDNSNFKKVMEKFEKFTNKKCHSKSEK